MHTQQLLSAECQTRIRHVDSLFHAHLLLPQDLSNYNKNAVAIAKKYFNVADIDDYYKKTDPKPLIFCHFARGLGDKVYNEVTEFKALYKTLMEVIVFTVVSSAKDESTFWLA